MISCGIDVGFKTAKAVLLNEDRNYIALLEIGQSDSRTAATQVLAMAMERAGLAGRDTEKYIITTGSHGYLIPFTKHYVTEAVCLSRGINQLSPSTEMVVDVGAEKVLAVRCCNGVPVSFASNDKCAGGSGRYLDITADMLNIPVSAMGELSLRSRKAVEVQSSCAVFAESEIISLVHAGEKPEDIVHGVLAGLASRIYTLCLKAGFKSNLSLVGGVARNSGFVRALEELMGVRITVPQNPEMVGALGAAILAKERLSR